MKIASLIFLACTACSVRSLSESEFLADSDTPPPAPTGISIDVVAVSGFSFLSADGIMQIDFIIGRGFQVGIPAYSYVGARNGGNGRQYIYQRASLFYGLIVNSATEIQFSQVGQSSANSIIWSSSNPADIITLTKL